MKKILIVIGTRPELIKVACIIKELERRNLRDRYVLINTSQHMDLLDPYWSIFGIQPDVTLEVMQKKQSLSSLTSRVIDQFQKYLDSIENKVGAVLAQGDTTTVFGVSLVSFYNGIPFYHLEAGLRSFDIYNPFPEEYNRMSTSLCTTIHFCPTAIARQNLLKEGIAENKIQVVGNTVVDALEFIKSYVSTNPNFENKLLQSIPKYQGKVLITCHRRENHGSNLLDIMNAIFDLANENKALQFIWAIHPNPNVMDVVLNSPLKDVENIKFVEPLSYHDLIRLLSQSVIAISDSGGIQEEAPSFNVPVLVLRKATERPESVIAGISALVGSDQELIKQQFYYYLSNKINVVANPYGDGKSSSRVVDVIMEQLN